MQVNRYVLGLVITLVGASCWGFSANFMQFVFADYGVPVLFVSAFRLFVSGALFLVALAFVQRDKLRALLRDAWSMRRLFVFGLGMFACQTSYMFAIDFTNAGTATVLQSTNVVMVLLYVCARTRRRPRASECGAVALAIVATVLIATKGDLSSLHIPPLGLFWGLMAALAVAFYVLYPRPLLAKWGSPLVVAVGFFEAGVVAGVLFALMAAFGVGGAADASWVLGMDAAGVGALLAIAIVGTLAAFGLYLYGVNIVGSVKGSLLGSVEPVVASVVSAVWLGTAFGWADWVGMVLMIATVFIVSLQPQQQETPAT